MARITAAGIPPRVRPYGKQSVLKKFIIHRSCETEGPGFSLDVGSILKSNKSDPCSFLTGRSSADQAVDRDHSERRREVEELALGIVG